MRVRKAITVKDFAFFGLSCFGFGVSITMAIAERSYWVLPLVPPMAVVTIAFMGSLLSDLPAIKQTTAADEQYAPAWD